MYTITQLAREFKLSRATLLYYEREQLLVPAQRGQNGYRWYGEKEAQRLQLILSYRAYGLPIADIKTLLNNDGNFNQSEILLQHFQHLENEITILRQQQKAIVAFLQQPQLLETTMVSKERWVEIMRAAGFNDDAMTRWHRKFEEMEPEEHAAFLKSLGISDTEIKRIRDM